MTTTFEENTSLKRQILFHTYVFYVNSTEIGPWAAAYIRTSVATDFDVTKVVRGGATMLASYFVPAAPLFFSIKKADKTLGMGKKVKGYGSLFYKEAKSVTSPIETINYLGAKGLQKYGATKAMKKYCHVQESGAFYWERTEYLGEDT